MPVQLKTIIYFFVLAAGLAPLSTQASSDVVNDPTYWVEDPALQETLERDGAPAVNRRMTSTIENGARQLASGKWQPTEEEAAALAAAMRWAVIRERDDLLPALDRIAVAPPGNVRANWHYALTYNGRWAAWLIRTRKLSPQQRVSDLIAVWRDDTVSLHERSFAEDRLVEEPQAAETLVTLTVEEVLPRAGTFKKNILHITDAEAARELSRLETVLAAQAQQSDEARKTIKDGLAGTALAKTILLE